MEQTPDCATLIESRRANWSAWSAPPAIRMSFAVHLSGLAALAIDPMTWSYVGAAIAGNHVVLGLAGLLPRSTWLGPNLRQLPAAAIRRREIALTFDDGPDPDTTLRVLDVLDRHRARASFFCVGAHAAAHRAIIGEIARRGHSVENHTQNHPAAFATYGVRRIAREIEAAQDTIASITGKAPLFFRAPAGLRNPLLDPVLARLRLRYVSWTRRGFDTVAAKPQRVLSRLTRGLSAGDVLALHDGACRGSVRKPSVVLSVLPVLMDTIAAAQLIPVSLVGACRTIDRVS